MSVTGIICEYDPLHTGHAWLMARARAAGASAVVCAMSGNFTQRGGFAAADKLARAEMAVACGADLVLELPTVWAMSTAERFARGGVEVLTRTGVVTELLFGSESGDMAALTRCADCLDSEGLTAALAAVPEDGRTFAARRQQAVEALLGPADAVLLASPNNTLGIAVGMASNICSFNLEELCNATIALMKDPQADLREIIPAPDFVGGGTILYDAAEMQNVLENGRGSVRVRAKWSYDKENNCIDVTQIPPTTTVEAIMDKITELVKLGKIREISDMRDETDLNGLKLTIDLKRGQDPDKLMARLYKATPLEDSFACNFNVLIAGQPKVLGVRSILNEWIAFRAECVRRRTYYDLQGKQKRLHLLKGLKAILLDIDKAIEIVRNTAEETEVVPNLMIGFGIDEVQAEYVAEIKLRHLNREYILKRTEEIEELENAIADLEDILKRPARINKIIMKELADVAKKYGKPRRCEIMYEVPAVEGDEPEQQIPDYPVHLFFTRDGYFKKITPQSLRMSGEQKLKDGDEVLFTCESTNSVELLFFTNHRQVYKSHAYDFNDSKASVLGDYVASALGMEEGEVPLYMVVTPDYKGWMLFFYDNGKCAKVPLSSYETKQNRRKLLKAYSDKAELAFMRHLPEETELAIFTTNNRLLLVGSALIPEKTTRDTAGVSVVALKKNAKIARVTLAEGLELNDAPRYRVRTLPAAGAILKDDDRAEQLTL